MNLLGINAYHDEHRLGARFKRQVVDHALVVVGDVGDGAGEREDEVEVTDRQELGLTLGQPMPRCGTLALGAVSVAAGVVGDLGMGTILAASDVPPSAAVRQRSIALITWSWPRLT